MPKQYNMLFKGMVVYWLIFPAMLYLATQSLSFLYYIWLQPLFCMTYFIAFMNFGYHGFVDFDGNKMIPLVFTYFYCCLSFSTNFAFIEKGQHIWCVNSITILDGEDDYFGEDDHMAHHYATNVYHRDLPKHRETKVDDFSMRLVLSELTLLSEKHHGSVFKQLSIVELALFILMKDWSKLADHYVDYTEKMTKQEIMDMLRVRAAKKDMTNQEYIKVCTATNKPCLTLCSG